MRPGDTGKIDGPTQAVAHGAFCGHAQPDGIPGAGLGRHAGRFNVVVEILIADKPLQAHLIVRKLGELPSAVDDNIAKRSVHQIRAGTPYACISPGVLSKADIASHKCIGGCVFELPDDFRRVGGNTVQPVDIRVGGGQFGFGLTVPVSQPEAAAQRTGTDMIRRGIIGVCGSHGLSKLDRQEIVFIGAGIDWPALRARLDACLIPKEQGDELAAFAKMADPFPPFRRAEAAA